MRLVLAVAFLLLLAGPARAGDAPRPAPRIAVVIELAVNVEASRADAIGAALADALNRELEVDAFGGADVSRTLPEDGLPDECLAHADCINDVANRLDAEQLLFLVVLGVGDDVQVDCSWVDLATGVVSARPRVVLGSDARAVSVFADAATRFLPDAKKREGNTIIVGPGPAASGGGHHMTAPAWITTSVAVAGLIAGGILAVSARATYERCDNLDGGCTDDVLDGLAHRDLAADVSFGVALGAAIATVVLYLRSDSSAATPDEHTGLLVTPTGDGAAVGFAGRF
jgi:hypothetical protein